MRLETEAKRFFNSIENKYYVTFFTAIVCGLFAHLYQFTNKNFNFDELGQTPAGFGAGIGLGRWGLELIGDFIGLFFRTYSIPMINGMITLILIAFSGCILVEVFDVKDSICCLLIGGILAVFPALIGTYFFMFTAPYYGFAMFLACLAGKMTVRGMTGERMKVAYMVGGFLLLVLSTSIYQSYCAVTLCVLLIDIIIGLYLGKMEWRKLLIRGIVYCLNFVIALGTYIGVTKLIEKISGMQLSGYRGMDSMGSVNLGAIAYSIIKTYIDYFSLMKNDEDVYQINPTVLVNVIFVVINYVLVILVIDRLRKKEELMYKIGYILSVLLMPIAMFFAEVMTQGRGGVYVLMVYSAVFVFILPLVLYDKKWIIKSETIIDYNKDELIEDEKQKRNKKDYIGRILCTAILSNILIYIWFANGNYQALQYTTYHDLAYFETLATQVKSLEGYSPDLKVALVGDRFDDSTFRAGGLMNEYFNIDGKWDTNINYFNNIYLWTRYLGFTPEVIEFRDSAYLSDMDEVKAMPCYPNDGSIAIVGDTVVIKASDRKAE